MKRVAKGDYNNLFAELKENPDGFYRYTRMTLVHFKKLLKITEVHLQKCNWRAFSPEFKLLIAIRYLATGNSPNTIALAFRVGESTVRKIVKEVCTVIIQCLQPKYLFAPSEDDWKKCADGFWEKWNLPNCVGSIDGKHIRIRAPPNSGSLYFNYKKYFSIILMAVADHLYRFTLVDIGAFGGMNDAGVFSKSNIGINLQNEQLHLPHEEICLPNSQLKTWYYFVADDAFKLSPRVMKPYSKQNLTYDEKIFNYRVSRARPTVESAFGILSNKWRILHTAITVLPETADLIVNASVCLHNYVLKEEQKMGVKRYSINVSNESSYPLNQNPPWMTVPNGNFQILNENHVLSGERQRTNLKLFFKSKEGQVEWQDEYVKRGTYMDK
ncbi:uncharacterized protein [Prorops nasuta]|uniref:uncharacterized protein n=1 Tax=Prorops nasuta TaxID=863751 RepID=UPI0034CD93E8